MTGPLLYRDGGLDLYERVHYGRGEQLGEVEAILEWFHSGGRVLDLGCSGGLHALEFARRGFAVTGVDREAGAVARARKRAGAEGLAADFRVLDLERGPLAPLGRFDLIYSIGNVLAHLSREGLAAVLRQAGEILADGGAFLCDLLMIAPGFASEVREAELGIVWNRRLDPRSGRIRLRGTFPGSPLSQDFLVQGYTLEEAIALLSGAGFTAVDVSRCLDFRRRPPGGPSPVCLRFRAQAWRSP